MRTSKVADRNRDLNDRHIAPGEEESRLLVRALKDLIGRLTRASEEEAGTPDEDRWEGDDYIYYEAELPEWLDLEVDLNLTGGRAFIRIAR